MLHIIKHVMGLDNPSGSWYALWSGIGSGIAPNLSQLAVLLLIWKRLQCHDDNCKMIGTHHVKGTHYVTCRKHHPVHQDGKKVTAHSIAQAHREAQIENFGGDS